MAFSGLVAPERLRRRRSRIARQRPAAAPEGSARVIVSERSTNWTIVPCPHPEWAALVYPELDEVAAYERLWEEIWHILRLDETDPAAAWDERMAALKRSASAMTERRFDAIELRGPGTELTVGLFGSSSWGAGDFMTREGLRHLPNLPTEEVFTTPDPPRTRGPRDLDEAARARRRCDRPRPARALRGRPSRRDRRRRERGSAAGEG